MGKAKLVMAILFVLALAAGLLAGMLVMHAPTGTGTAAVEASARTPLAEELQLSADQSQQMRSIWEGVRQQVDGCFGRAQELQKRRDEAVAAILTPEQKAVYAKLQQGYIDAVIGLKAERDAAFADAVKRTEQILSEPQRQRYREILKSRVGEAPPETPDWLAAPATMPGDAGAKRQGAAGH